MISYPLTVKLKPILFGILVTTFFVDLSFSLQRQQSLNPSNVKLNPSSEKNATNQPFTFEDFFINTNLSSIINVKAFHDFMNVIEDKSRHVEMSLRNFNITRELVFSFLRLDIVSNLRKFLSRRPVSSWLPQGSGVSDICYNHLMMYLEGLIGHQSSNSSSDQLITTEWALQMLDSVGKPSSGLLQGRLQLIGDYDQCVSVRVIQQEPIHYGESTPVFKGRYCRVRLPMSEYIDRRLPENVNTFWLDAAHLPININWGVCVPDTCSQQDIKAFLTQGTLHTLSLPVEDVLCFQDKELINDPGALFVISLLSFLGMSVALCTVLDLYTSIRDSNPSPSSPCWCVAHVASAQQANNMTMPTSCGGDAQEDSKECENRPTEGRCTNPDLLTEMTVLNKEIVTSKLENSTDVASISSSTLEKADIISPSKEVGSHNHVGEKGDGCVGHKGEINEGFEMREIRDQVPGHSSEDGIKDSTNCEHDQHCQESNHSAIDVESKMERRDKISQEKGEKKKSVKGKKYLCWHIIKGASLYTNFMELMNTDVSSSKRIIRCVEGLKAITMAWVVLGHTYTFGGIIDENNIVYDNALEMTNIPDRLAFHIGVGSAQFGVDTFFVICGCLVMFISLDKLKEAKQTWQFWTCFIFRRFWRLTPIYMTVLAIGTNLYDHIVYGPLKAHNLEEFHECREKWWAHLLYINNLFKPTQKCMTWTWYLAVDMQLHVLSPLFIYPVYRNRRLGVVLIVGLLVMSMLSAFCSELTYGGQFLLMDMNFTDYWSHVYTVPWSRASAFAIGLLLGVVLRDLDRSKPHAWETFLARKWCQRLFSPIMWTLNIGVGVALALVNHAQWRHGSGHWDKLSLAAFECLSRPLWSMAVAWVIFACNTGRAGPIVKVLSFSPFVVLSRLCYSVYLLHPLVILFVVYSRRTAIYLHPDRIDQVYNYLGNLVLTHLFAMLLYLFVEAPLRNLDVLWEPRRTNKEA